MRQARGKPARLPGRIWKKGRVGWWQVTESRPQPRALTKPSFGWKQADGPDDMFILFFPGLGSIHDSEGHLLRKTELIWNFETLSVNILGLLSSWLRFEQWWGGTDVYAGRLGSQASLLLPFEGLMGAGGNHGHPDPWGRGFTSVESSAPQF